MAKRTPEEIAEERIEEARHTRARELDLEGLGLTTLPAEIGQLTALTVLHLSGNQLAMLPAEIGQLTALTGLYLANNQLTTLPAEISQRTALTELNLSFNQLTTLPAEIGQMTALTGLNLSGNQLTTLPAEIGQLTALTVLHLSGNQLTMLPAEIGQMTALTGLYLVDNQLTTLPAEIGQLTALTELYLVGNQLTTLPAEIGQLTTLTELNLSGNQLTMLPAEIGQLTALTGLYLVDNQLTTLPAAIGQLTALTWLALSGNQLTTLSAEIGQLKALTVLNLSGNQLTMLPAEIGQLTALTELYLHGNPALKLPPEVVGATFEEIEREKLPPTSPRSILDYYFSLQEDAAEPLNELKLLLVGRGEAGKTSLSRTLRGEKFDKHQKETPGIEIRPWRAHCSGGTVRIHVWDFAGQEITHETHRFFLSQRSLYLVVLDGRGGQQMEEAEYWLSHVEKYGTTRASDRGGLPERSPVIVVLNKWQSPGPYDVEKRRVRREYPNIVAFVETDCATGHGLERLKETIFAAVEQMPSVRQPWPRSYQKVRDALGALSSSDDPAERAHFLTWSDYRQVCERCGVSEEGKQASLAENLNSLGIALYYGDDERLRDTRVLNPNWAANGLYGLIRGVQRIPYQGQPGQLWAGEIGAVLAEGMKGMPSERGATIDDYPEEKKGVRVHDFLLGLLQDRELGFIAREEKGQPLYLMPSLFALDEPEPAEYDVAAHMETAQVRFRYLYEILPAGVMSRFIVRTHALSDELYRWQRGVVLAWRDARALIMAERRRSPRIDVFIRGGTPAERQEMAGIVRSNLEDIHRGLPEGLRGDEELDLTPLGDQYESVAKLTQLEAENRQVQVVTPAGSQLLDTTAELDQVQPAHARREDVPKLKVFVSYSHANYADWNRLRVQLDVLKNENLVGWWFDGKILPGREWDDAIRHELRSADIILLLLSNAFFASEYISGVELKEARFRHQSGESWILPVLLQPSEAFHRHPWLREIQAVPSVSGKLRPLTTFNPRDNGWNEVQKALRTLITEIAARRKK